MLYSGWIAAKDNEGKKILKKLGIKLTGDSWTNPDGIWIYNRVENLTEEQHEKLKGYYGVLSWNFYQTKKEEPNGD